MDKTHGSPDHEQPLQAVTDPGASRHELQSSQDEAERKSLLPNLNLP
jgi:hypothetical protein